MAYLPPAKRLNAIPNYASTFSIQPEFTANQVAVVILRHGLFGPEVLLQQRSNKKWKNPGKLALPQARMMRGQNALATCCRMIIERTSLYINPRVIMTLDNRHDLPGSSYGKIHLCEAFLPLEMYGQQIIPNANALNEVGYKYLWVPLKVELSPFKDVSNYSIALLEIYKNFCGIQYRV
jgi:8-oxo-dGTP pyrophosphatase MutT (NUDIX family)